MGEGIKIDGWTNWVGKCYFEVFGLNLLKVSYVILNSYFKGCAVLLEESALEAL